MADLEKIVGDLDSLTLLEASELAKMLQEKWGVSAAAPVAVMPGAAGPADGAEVEEKTEFDVVLQGPGDKKIQVIKAVRELTPLGLKEAKDLVDSAPATILQGVPKEAANEAKDKLEAAGGSVEIK